VLRQVHGARFQAVVARRRVESVSTSDSLNKNRGAMVKRPASCSPAISRRIEAYAINICGCQVLSRVTMVQRFAGIDSQRRYAAAVGGRSHPA